MTSIYISHHFYLFVNIRHLILNKFCISPCIINSLTTFLNRLINGKTFLFQHRDLFFLHKRLTYLIQLKNSSHEADVGIFHQLFQLISRHAKNLWDCLIFVYFIELLQHLSEFNQQSLPRILLTIVLHYQSISLKLLTLLNRIISNFVHLKPIPQSRFWAND